MKNVNIIVNVLTSTEVDQFNGRYQYGWKALAINIIESLRGDMIITDRTPWLNSGLIRDRVAVSVMCLDSYLPLQDLLLKEYRGWANLIAKHLPHWYPNQVICVSFARGTIKKYLVVRT